MAKTNIEKMSLKELLDLQMRVERAVVQARERERSAVKEKIEAIARGAGMSLSELFGRRASKGSKVAAKYRNPDDPSETWAGRGRQPRWLAAKLKAGSKMEKFLIG